MIWPTHSPSPEELLARKEMSIALEVSFRSLPLVQQQALSTAFGLGTHPLELPQEIKDFEHWRWTVDRALSGLRPCLVDFR